MHKRIKKHAEIKTITVLICVFFMVPSTIKRGNATNKYLGIDERLPVNVGPTMAKIEKKK